MWSKLRDALNVFLVSTAWCEFPPVGYGGIETVIWNLILGATRTALNIKFGAFSVRDTARHPAVRKLGIKVWYIFKEGLYARYISDPNEKLWIEQAQALAAYKKARQLLESQRMRIDLFHDHTTGFSTVAAEIKDRPPVLLTLHGSLSGPFVTTYLKLLKDVEGMYFNSISDSQQKGAPWLPFIDTVHDGIDTEMFPYQEEKLDPSYLIIIGRIAHDKGQQEAIEVARARGMNLVIAGLSEKTLEGDRYWRKRIKPEIDIFVHEDRDPLRSTMTLLRSRNGEPKVIYFGQADFNQKVILFGGASCSLTPINWEEPFGLVMPEAMACGTPVVAFNRGAAPEIVKDGETGFLANDTGEMIEAVKRIGQISPRACRQRVETHFSAEVMARNYFKVYQEILNRERARKKA